MFFIMSGRQVCCIVGMCMVCTVDIREEIMCGIFLLGRQCLCSIGVNIIEQVT